MLGKDCWFCDQSGVEELIFDIEFNTPVHKSCIINKLKEDRTNTEALVMSYLVNKESNQFCIECHGSGVEVIVINSDVSLTTLCHCVVFG